MTAIEITEANFNEVVLKSNKPVLVDFWAVWCGPCKAIGPLIEEIAREYKGKVVVGKINVDANRGLSTKFGIRSVPALFIFKNGIVVDRCIGSIPSMRSIITEKLKAQLR